MSNFDARPLQRQLISKGFLPAVDPATNLPNDDGTFGTLTQAALIKFQEANKLTPSGQPDDPTMIALGLKTQPPAVVKWSLPTFSIPAFASDYLLNWVTSKINIWSAAMSVAIIAVLNGALGKLGVQLDAQQQAAVAALLAAVMGIGVNILRTFFNKPKVVDGKVALKAE